MPERKLFAQQRLNSHIDGLKEGIPRALAKMDKDYLLKASETDLCESLVSERRLDVPVLLRDQAEVLEPQDAQIDVSQEPRRVIFDRSKPFYVTGTSVTVAVPFRGPKEAFHFQPSTFSTREVRAEVLDQELRLSYVTTEPNAESLRNEIDRDLANVESYLNWMRQDVEAYNDQLPELVRNAVEKRKAKLLADQGLVASLGIPIKRRPQDSLTFMPPEIKRKPPIRRPQVAPGKFEPEPSLDEEEYAYILDIMQNMVRVMELSPTAFAALDEEALRFHVLVQLNGHYEGLATGETFSFQGNTDILIRYDSGNAFIAECMIWHGRQSLLNKLDQLLRYVTWRDTKAAVVLFSRNKDFSAVLQKIRDTVSTHDCHKRDLGQPSETQFRYLFHQPRDPNREVTVTILAFDVPCELSPVEAGAGSDPETPSTDA